MYATILDLPPELINRIVNLLVGKQPRTWEENSWEVCPRLRLSKRELAKCSLVCKYWAKIVRGPIFKRLAIKTPADGRLFRSFIERPATPELSIGKLVQALDLECDLAGPPWLHHVFASWQPDLPDSVFVEVFHSSRNSPSARLRSIHRSLPRPLPPRMTRTESLRLRKVPFADFADLGKFLASVTVEHVVLQDIIIKDMEKLCISSPLPHRMHPTLSVGVSGVEAPMRLLRALLPVRNQCGAHACHVQPHVLPALEKALSAITRVGERSSATNESKDLRSCTFRLSFGSPREDLEIVPWSLTAKPAINSINVKFARDGTLAVIRLDIDADRYVQCTSLPWGKLDQDLRTLIPDVEALLINVFHVDPFDDLADVLSREMTAFTRLGKLYIGCFEDGWDRVEPGGSSE